MKPKYKLKRYKNRNTIHFDVQNTKQTDLTDYDKTNSLYKDSCSGSLTSKRSYCLPENRLKNRQINKKSSGNRNKVSNQ